MRAFLTVLLLSAAALAQQPGELPDSKPAQASQPQQVTAEPVPAGFVVIPAGTEIPLKLAQGLEELSQAGQRLGAVPQHAVHVDNEGSQVGKGFHTLLKREAGIQPSAARS